MERTGKTIRTRLMECVNCRFRAHAKDMEGAAHQCPQCGHAVWVLVLHSNRQDVIVEKVRLVV